MKPLLLLALLGPSAFATDALPPVRLLIVDGQNNHRWQETTPYLREFFELSDRFATEVATAPPSPNSPEGKARYASAPDRYQKDMEGFRPKFEQFDAILLNYYGDAWPEETHAALEEAIYKGKGLIVVHAANNAFFGRQTYARMLGLAWRPADFGVRLEIDEAGQTTRIPAGTGPGAGHGKQHPFQVRVREPEHAINKGMPAKWMHAKDELYHGLRGPAEEVTILATAYSDPAKGGTGSHEPIAWTVKYGQGRVFHLVLGHDVSAMRCVGFITLLLRGSEWAASGQVTIPIPPDFPTEDNVRTKGGWWLTPEYAKPLWPFILALLVVGILGWRWRRTRKKSLPS